MTLWLIIGAIGLLTFATRLSFILIASHGEIPLGVRRALGFVPVAVLSAIVVPAPNGTPLLTLANPRLLAGAVAVMVAWRTRNPIITIITGMLALWLLQLLVH